MDEHSLLAVGGGMAEDEEECLQALAELGLRDDAVCRQLLADLRVPMPAGGS